MYKEYIADLTEGDCALGEEADAEAHVNALAQQAAQEDANSADEAAIVDMVNKVDAIKTDIQENFGQELINDDVYEELLGYSMMALEKAVNEHGQDLEAEEMAETSLYVIKLFVDQAADIIDCDYNDDC